MVTLGVVFECLVGTMLRTVMHNHRKEKADFGRSTPSCSEALLMFEFQLSPGSTPVWCVDGHGLETLCWH